MASASALPAHARLQAETEGTCLRLTRDFRAAPSAVFAAWTEPAALAAWWGPNGFTARILACDVSAGGRLHYLMVDGDGREFHEIGTFLEVSPPHRLVLLEDCAGMGEEWLREVAPELVAASGKVEVLWRLTLRTHDGGTRLVLELDCPTPAMLASLSGKGMTDGWAESFEKLDRLLLPHRHPAPEIHS